MKTQFSSKYNNVQNSDDDTTKQIQIHRTWAEIIIIFIAIIVIFIIGQGL